MLLICLIPNAFGASVEQSVKELRQDLKRLQKSPDIVGLAVSVIQGQEVLLRQTYGISDVESKQEIDAKTRFRLASLSKGFASSLAASLVEDEQLDWNEPLEEHLSWFKLPTPENTQTAKLDHVLSHRLGLHHYTHDRLLESNWQVQTIISNFDKLDPRCDVGTCYGYQNIGYNLVADLVEAKTGEPFETLVKNRLFDPLDMRRANFGEQGLQADENWAKPHSGRRPKLLEVLPTYYRVPAAAGINACLLDMEQWLKANLALYPKVLSTEMLDELREPLVLTRREIVRGGWRGRRVKNAWYGRGWRIYDYRGHTMIYHAGAVAGYRAQLAIIPELKIGVIAMWNSESGKPWGVVPRLADALFGLKAVDWMKLGPLTSSKKTTDTKATEQSTTQITAGQ